jgi:hypothetical protein
MRPFITFYTPTYKRPEGLAKCLASVAQQTAVRQIEQIVIPDHVGIGIAGMYQLVPEYAKSVHGDYVHILADDDVLASPTVVEQVQQFAIESGYPPVIIVRVVKGGLALPIDRPWPPVCGRIDLGCAITRADVWQAFAHRYGSRYEGDFDYMDALCQAGYPAAFLDVLFLVGGVSRGEPEAVEVGPCQWVGGRVATR